MLLTVLQCFHMTLSRKIIVFKPTLLTTNKFFFLIRFISLFVSPDKVIQTPVTLAAF